MPILSAIIRMITFTPHEPVGLVWRELGAKPLQRGLLRRITDAHRRHPLSRRDLRQLAGVGSPWPSGANQPER
jgi:hypothetical protein